MFRKVIKHHILFIIIVALSACHDEEKSVFEHEDQREYLSQLVMSRSQVYHVIYNDDQLSISFYKGDVQIDTRLIKYLYLDEKGYWNGKDLTSTIKAFRDKNGVVEFPSLVLGWKGSITVDEQAPNFSNVFSVSSVSSFPDNIWAIANSGERLCFYGDNCKQVIIPIANDPNFIIPEYYLDQVVEKEIISENIEDAIPEGDCYRYVFFTDAHWGRNQKHSPAIIKHTVDYSSIPLVLFGGDVITSRTKTVQEALAIGFQFKNAFAFLGEKLLCLFGNHDDNSTGQVELIDRHLTEEQVYSYLQSQSKDVVCYGDYYNYYFDDPKTKTRIICLDTGRFYEKTARQKFMGKTAKFVIECLSTVPDGWHIVVAGHLWLRLRTYETGEAIESPFTRPIVKILENFNSRVKSSYSDGDEILSYDFSNANATVEYCIGGHIHADRVVLSEKGIPLISVACDGQQEVVGGVSCVTGTISEQCVTIIVNDYLNKKVHIYHIGRGEDVIVKMWDYS